MQASHRYHLEQLNLLQKTCNQTFYGKRRQSNYGLSASLKVSKHNQQKDRRKNHMLQSTQKGYEGTKSQLTTEIIKHKLHLLFTKNISKTSSLSVNLNHHQREEGRRKSESFRITAYRHPFRRRNYPKGQQLSNQRVLEDIGKQFQVKQACIERRQSANDPIHYQRLGLRRNFLKFHGQHKCFEKAVQFKGNKGQQKGEKLTASVSKQKLELIKDCSLQYSSDQAQWGQVEGWRKPIQILEWSVFSNLQGSVN